MDVRRSDVSFQRLVFLLLVAGTAAAALLLGAFDRYRDTLVEWVTADAGRSARRIELIFAAFAVLLLAPIVAIAAYLSSLGRRAARAQEYPPPGFRVLRDTPIIRGHEALSKGRSLQGIAVFLSAAAVLIGLLFWKLASLFTVPNR